MQHILTLASGLSDLPKAWFNASNSQEQSFQRNAAVYALPRISDAQSRSVLEDQYRPSYISPNGLGALRSRLIRSLSVRLSRSHSKDKLMIDLLIRLNQSCPARRAPMAPTRERRKKLHLGRKSARKTYLWAQFQQNIYGSIRNCIARVLSHRTWRIAQ